jgi:hypothetical protein
MWIKHLLHRLIVAASLAVLILTAATLAGCYPYPVYTPTPTAPPVSKFDRVWDAAYGAATDVGVKIQSADRNSGMIQGMKDAVAVSIYVRTQADGSVAAEITAKGPASQQQAVSDQISQAYERRMGR